MISLISGDGLPEHFENIESARSGAAMSAQPKSPRSPKSPASRKPRRRSVSQRHQLAPTPLAPTEFAEPDLLMLLGDPEVRLVMQADHVDEHELLAMLNSISLTLRGAVTSTGAGDDSASRQPRQASDEEYRPGVGIILINARNEVFVGQRIDAAAWQMPQGGINRGETPREAALRELREEIGTDKVAVLAESDKWLYYDVPEALARKAWGGRWRGQRQKWFVMLFNGADQDIDLATGQPEFAAWRWVSLAELAALVVSFKRQLYLNVLGEFPFLFRD